MEEFDTASIAAANQSVLTALIALLEAEIPDIRENLVGVFSDALAMLDLAEPGEQTNRRRKIAEIARDTVMKKSGPMLTVVPRD